MNMYVRTYIRMYKYVLIDCYIRTFVYTYVILYSSYFKIWLVEDQKNFLDSVAYIGITEVKSILFVEGVRVRTYT